MARVNILIYLVPQCSPFAKIAPKVITTRGKVCPPACPALLEEHSHTKENQTAILATKEHFELAVKSMLQNVCFVALVLRKTWRHKVRAPSVVEVSISRIQVLQRVLFATLEPTWKMENTYAILQCANNVLWAGSMEKVKHLAVHAFPVNFNLMLNVPRVISFIIQIKKVQAIANNVLSGTNLPSQKEVLRVSNVRLGNMATKARVVHAQQGIKEKIRTPRPVASHVPQQRIKMPRSK